MNNQVQVYMMPAISCLRERDLKKSFSSILYKMNPWNFVWISVVCSVILAAIFNSIQGILFWGRISRDLLIIGTIDSVIISSAVVSLIIYFVRNTASLELRVNERTVELQEALEQIKTLRGIVPICSHCKQIRNDEGFWSQVEHYVEDHTHVKFSHGICPECKEEHYHDFITRRNKK